MTTLNSLTGLEFFLVRRWVLRLRRLDHREDRAALLEDIQIEDGKRIRDLAEAAFREEWEAKQEQAA